MARHVMTLDIHNYEEQIAGAQRQLMAAQISTRNKELILGYRDACLIKATCGKVRLIRVVGALSLFARMLNKDFDTWTKADVESLLTGLLTRQPPYSAETLSSYKAIIKLFMTWTCPQF